MWRFRVRTLEFHAAESRNRPKSVRPPQSLTENQGRALPSGMWARSRVYIRHFRASDRRRGWERNASPCSSLLKGVVLPLIVAMGDPLSLLSKSKGDNPCCGDSAVAHLFILSRRRRVLRETARNREASRLRYHAMSVDSGYTALQRFAHANGLRNVA